MDRNTIIEVFKEHNLKTPSSPEMAKKEVLNLIQDNPEMADWVRTYMQKLKKRVLYELSLTKGGLDEFVSSLLPSAPAYAYASESETMKRLLAPQRAQIEKIIADSLYGILTEKDWDKKVLDEIEEMTKPEPVTMHDLRKTRNKKILKFRPMSQRTAGHLRRMAYLIFLDS